MRQAIIGCCFLMQVIFAMIPQGFHTSWSLEGGLYISWAEVNSTEKLGAGNPRCIIEASNDTYAFQANSTTYNDTCDDLNKCVSWKGWLHTAEIPSNISNQQKFISYKCGNDINGFSNSTILRTRYEEQGKEVSFIFIADVGADNGAPIVSEALQNITYNENKTSDPTLDFIIMAGDIAYANGNQFGWDDFFEVWEPVMKSVPTLFTPGNHDGEWEFGNMYTLPYSKRVDGGESGNAYSLRLPGPGKNLFWKSRYPNVPNMYSTSYWYAVSYGGMRIISTSGTHEFEPGSEQYAWLVDELKKANTPQARAKEPWVIVTNHYPIYCTIDDCFCGNYTVAALQQLCQDTDNIYIPGVLEITANRMFQAFESLMGEYKVDLFLAGHEHCYERTLPVNNFEVNPKNNITSINARYVDPNATVHVMAGTGGGSPDVDWRNKSDFEWSSIRSDGQWSDTNPYGFVKLTLSGDRTELGAEYLNMNVSGKPQILDKFSIVRTDIHQEVEHDKNNELDNQNIEKRTQNDHMEQIDL